MSVLKHFRSSKAKDEIYGDPEPQVGFKLAFNTKTGEITVKVMGAKQLPTSYGSAKTQGYLIKVRLGIPWCHSSFFINILIRKI